MVTGSMLMIILFLQTFWYFHDFEYQMYIKK